MTVKLPKRRGRPTKAESALKLATKMAKVKVRSDAEILEDLIERFNVLSKLTVGAVNQNVRAATITGAPGVGKTYTVENILNQAAEHKNTQFDIVRGSISAVELYKLGYRMSAPGSIIVIDDADSVFSDEDALNVLKVLCDSTKHRRVSWLKDSNTLKEDDTPRQYDFNGSMIFISNLNFQHFIDIGKNKFVPHFEALMSRSLYLDLRLHTRDEIGVWVEYVATKGRMLQSEGLSESQGEQVLKFIRTNRNNLRDLSLRTVQKISQLILSDRDWETMARICLLKH